MVFFFIEQKSWHVTQRWFQDLRRYCMEIITLQRTQKIVGAPCVFFLVTIPAACLWSCWWHQSSPDSQVSPWQAVLARRGGQEVRRRDGWAGRQAVRGRRSRNVVSAKPAWVLVPGYSWAVCIYKDSAFSSANVEVTPATEVDEYQRIQRRKHNGGHLLRVRSISIPFPYHVFLPLLGKHTWCLMMGKVSRPSLCIQSGTHGLFGRCKP